MRCSSKSDPSIVQGDDELPLVQLQVDLSTSEQHQRVDRHHAAVSDEDAAGFHLLVVNQVRTVVVTDLEDRQESERLIPLIYSSIFTDILILVQHSHRVVNR